MNIKKRPLRAVLLLTLFVALLSFALPTRADNVWQAKYYNNLNLDGNPVFTRAESRIDHNWGDGSPDPSVNIDGFSAVWSTNINIETAGTYRFVATMDDGMRVWVDGSLLIDSWYDSQAHTVTADRYLDTGQHGIHVEYYEAGGDAVAQFSWGPAAGPISNWRGEYFNNKNLTGQSALVRDDAAINFNWGTGSPSPGAIQAEEFSVRWTRSLAFEPGRHRFTVTVDDGVRLWVNNQLIINQWHDQPATTYSAEINLPGGTVPIRMEYYDNRAQALATLSWVKLADSVPSPTPSSPGAATGPGWQAAYYNNVSLDGSPVAQRTDSSIDFVWGSSSPIPNVVNPDRFSVRWTRSLNLPAGTYTFSAHVEGGVRVWVNNQLVIDAWNYIYEVRDYSGNVTVPGGSVPVVVEYFEHVGLAEISLDWQLAGSASSGSSAGGGSAASTPQLPAGSNTAVMTGAAHLSVRSGPGLDFEAFEYLSNGEVVELLGRDPFTIWIRVRLNSGEEGWVSGRYLTSAVPLSSLPIVAQS